MDIILNQVLVLEIRNKVIEIGIRVLKQIHLNIDYLSLTTSKKLIILVQE